ncbi:DUF2726 domain-containing protein [Ottowia sp.]|uniref:DUF2726 domain-containing protein n=1 Tax=Ottowia sp. TaxID=1898956 RepID=UPI002D1FB8D8|nr:DUF2726 domain-containing protein [Ottowia sp.]
MLTDWAGSVTMNGLVLAVVLLLLLSALVALWWRGSYAPRTDPATSAGDEFAPRAPITDEQVALLRYLQAAFPDGAVLFRPRLGHFLSVRKGRDRVEARQWLNARRVDFLLCAEDGKPLYAFEIDSLHDRDDPHAQRRMAEKNRALRSAGIRLIRFKGALATWPAPEVLRQRVLSAARPAPTASGFTDSGFASSGFAASTSFENSGYAATGRSSTGFQTSQADRAQGGAYSDVMSLTDLMRLQPANEGDPWSGIRKRS